MIGEKYQYSRLKDKYTGFRYPVARVFVNGKDIAENKQGIVLSELEVDLSTGYEASEASFTLYNVYDRKSGKYTFSAFREYVTLGSSVSIELGYSNQMTEIFRGFLASVRFANEQGLPHHIEVMALDVKGIMMSGSYCRQMTATSYGKAVEEIFSGELYQNMKSQGIFSSLNIMATPDQNAQGQPEDRAIEMVMESDYEFVVKAAKRFNYEFYIDTGEVCFRKAKSTLEDLLIKLGNLDGVFDYDITYDITGLVKKVEVRGVDTTTGKLVSATASVSNRISKGSKAKALIGKKEKVVIDANAVTKEQAQYRADSLMEEAAYRFGSLSCRCIGLPELMPGHFIKIEDLGEPCDAMFYITNARHVINDRDGYHTYITAMASSIPG